MACCGFAVACGFAGDCGFAAEACGFFDACAFDLPDLPIRASGSHEGGSPRLCHEGGVAATLSGDSGRQNKLTLGSYHCRNRSVPTQK